MIAIESLIGVMLYFLIVLAVGTLAWRRGILGSSEDYFLAGRKVKTVALIGTLFASWFSTFAFLGAPGQFFSNGTQWLQFGLFNALGPILIWVFGRKIWLLGKIHGYITPSDFLAGYYRHPGIRVVTAVLCVMIIFPYAAIQLSGIAKAMSAATNGLLPYWFGATIIVISVGLYTYFGGCRAIIWTDVLQGLFFAAMLTATAVAVVRWSGGWNAGISQAVRVAPERFLFEPQRAGDYYSLALIWTVGWVLTPHMWQKMYMADNPKALATSAVTVQILAFCVVAVPSMVIGYFGIGLLGGLPVGLDSDALVPTLFATFLPVGGVLLVVAVFAVGMSTLDSHLLTVSSVFANDVYRKFSRSEISESQVRTIGHRFMLVFSVMLLLFALSAPGRNLVIPLSSVGVGCSLLFLPSLVGATYWRRGTPQGAFWSMVLGAVAVCLAEFTPLNAFWHSVGASTVAGFVVSIVVFVVVSLLTPRMPDEQIRSHHGVLRTKDPTGLAANTNSELN